MTANWMHYHGPSMTPTLKVGDGLQVLPLNDRQVRPGDVIVFQHPVKKTNIVHRVVRVERQGLRTRGDNNSEDDPWWLQPEQVIGQVVCVASRDTTRPLAAGKCGLVLVAFVRLRRAARSGLRKLLLPVYRALADSGLFRGWLRWRAPLRLVCFQRPQGVEMHLFLGKHPVGRRSAGARNWQIRAPYRLFVNEQSLPPAPLKSPADPASTTCMRTSRKECIAAADSTPHG